MKKIECKIDIISRALLVFRVSKSLTRSLFEGFGLITLFIFLSHFSLTYEILRFNEILPAIILCLIFIYRFCILNRQKILEILTSKAPDEITKIQTLLDLKKNPDTPLDSISLAFLEQFPLIEVRNKIYNLSQFRELVVATLIFTVGYWIFYFSSAEQEKWQNPTIPKESQTSKENAPWIEIAWLKEPNPESISNAILTANVKNYSGKFIEFTLFTNKQKQSKSIKYPINANNQYSIELEHSVISKEANLVILQAKIQFSERSPPAYSNKLVFAVTPPMDHLKRASVIYGFEDLIELMAWMIEQQTATIQKTEKLALYQIYPQQLISYERLSRLVLEEQIILRDKTRQATETFAQDKDDFFPNEFWKDMERTKNEIDQSLVSLELTSWYSAVPHQERALNYMLGMLDQFRGAVENSRFGSTNFSIDRTQNRLNTMDQVEISLVNIIDEQNQLNKEISLLNNKFHEMYIHEYEERISQLYSLQLDLINKTKKQANSLNKGLSQGSVNKSIESMKKLASSLKDIALPKSTQFEEIPLPQEAEEVTTLLRRSIQLLHKEELKVIGANLFEMMSSFSQYRSLISEHSTPEFHNEFAGRMLLSIDIIEVIISRVNNPLLYRELRVLYDTLQYQYQAYLSGFRDQSEIDRMIKRLAVSYKICQGMSDYLIEIKALNRKLLNQSSYYMSISEWNSENEQSFLLWVQDLIENQFRITTQMEILGSNNPAINRIGKCFHEMTQLYKSEHGEQNLFPIIKEFNRALQLQSVYLESLFLNR